MKFVFKFKELMDRKSEWDGVRCTNAAIVRATGLNKTTVGLYVAGRVTKLDIETLLTLAKYFGVSSIAELIDIEG